MRRGVSTLCGWQLEAVEARTLHYKQHYTTLQSDGSEDDLAYLVMVNYGEKVPLFSTYTA